MVLGVPVARAEPVAAVLVAEVQEAEAEPAAEPMHVAARPAAKAVLVVAEPAAEPVHVAAVPAAEVVLVAARLAAKAALVVAVPAAEVPAVEVVLVAVTDLTEAKVQEGQVIGLTRQGEGAPKAAASMPTAEAGASHRNGLKRPGSSRKAGGRIQANPPKVTVPAI